MPTNKVKNETRRAKVILAASGFVVLVVAGIGIALMLSEEGFDQTVIDELLARNMNVAAALVILLMIAHCFIPFPAEALALAAGALFGVLVGVVLIWVGAMIGAALSFWLARRLGRPFVMAILSTRHAERIDSISTDQASMVLLTGRLLPIIAFNLINYAAGLTQVRWSTFLWTTGVGILPLTILVVWMGAEMRGLSMQTMIALPAGLISLLLVGWFFWRRFRSPR